MAHIAGSHRMPDRVGAHLARRIAELSCASLFSCHFVCSLSIPEPVQGIRKWILFHMVSVACVVYQLNWSLVAVSWDRRQLQLTQVEASRVGDDIDDDDDDDAQPRGGSPQQLPFGLLGSLSLSRGLSSFLYSIQHACCCRGNCSWPPAPTPLGNFKQAAALSIVCGGNLRSRRSLMM